MTKKIQNLIEKTRLEIYAIDFSNDREIRGTMQRQKFLNLIVKLKPDYIDDQLTEVHYHFGDVVVTVRERG